MFRLAAAALSVGLLSGQAKQSPEELLKEAVAFHQQGKLDEAIRDYQVFLDMYPKAAEVRSNLGAALAATGRYELAIDQYRRSLAAKPNPGVQLNLALALFKAGNVPDAAVELAKVHAAEPQNTQATLLLATSELRLGENKKVIDLLTPVRQAQPSDLGVAYLLGTALVRDGQSDLGQQVINPILSQGDTAEARMLMGTTRFAAHEYAPAVADLKKASELNPNLPDVFGYYGLALFATGNLEESRKAFQTALDKDPNNFDANLHIGTMLRQDQNYEGAVPYLEKAIRLRPGDLAVRYQIALVNLALNKVDAARDELESVVKAAPTFIEAHVSLATIYYRQKRREDGDRERAIVQKLNAERQAEQPGAKAAN